MITDVELDNWFTYHAPNHEQLRAFAEVRDAARIFASAIVKWTPACPDQTAAIRKVREATMTANAAIACGGK